MNKKLLIKKILFNCIFLILINSLFHTTVFTIENKIVLKVDNKIITTIDINNEAKYLKALNPKLNDLNKDKMYEIAKGSLVRETIKEIEILKNEIKINDEYLENLIKNIYSNIGLKNKNEFIDHLSKFNIDIETVIKKISNEANWNQLIFIKFGKKVKIDKKKIDEDIKSIKNISRSYLLYEIVFNANQKKEIEKLSQNIIKSINEIGFENTASAFSISESAKVGGKLGWINESSLDKKILQQMLSINQKQYTSPIIIPGGFLILYIEDIKEEEQEIDYETEFTNRIRSITNQQLNQFSNIYFNKIRKDININES